MTNKAERLCAAATSSLPPFRGDVAYSQITLGNLVLSSRREKSRGGYTFSAKCEPYSADSYRHEVEKRSYVRLYA